MAGCKKSDSSAAAAPGSGGGRKLTIALMPKSKGNAYFISCKQGADQAAKELGVELFFDGPPIRIRQSRTKSWRIGSRLASM